MSPRAWPVVLAVTVLTVFTLAAFWPGIDGDFLNWDDDRNFVENTSYRGLGLDQLRWAWSTYHLGVWQPLSWMLFGLEFEMGEMDPVVYHRSSLVLHVLNAVVFYWMAVTILRCALRRSCGIEDPRARTAPAGIHVCAAAAALLFATHPLRVEAVAWISCQPYLPAALFYQLAICIYVGGRDPTAARTLSRGRLAAVFVCYILAVTSKAVAVSLPVVLLILDVYPLRRWHSRRGRWARLGMWRGWAEKIPFIVVAMAVSLWAAAAKDYSESRVPFSAFDPDARLAQSAYGLVFYIWKTISPFDLIPYYRVPEDLSLFAWRYGLAAVGVGVVTVFLVLWRRRAPAALAAWAAYIVILLPNLGLVEISQQIAADRYSYLAVMPVMVLFGGALFTVWQRTGRNRRLARSAVVIGVVAAALALTTASRRQTAAWRDSLSLWRTTLEVDPRCAVAECQLGHALATQSRLEEAVVHLESAIALKPEFSFARSNLGAILYAQGRFADAAEHLERALAVGPALGKRDLAKTHAGLGAAYAGLGRYDAAWKHTREARRLGLEAADKMIEYLRGVSEEPTTPAP